MPHHFTQLLEASLPIALILLLIEDWHIMALWATIMTNPDLVRTVRERKFDRTSFEIFIRIVSTLRNGKEVTSWHDMIMSLFGSSTVLYASY